jgi:hypothetical protein
MTYTGGVLVVLAAISIPGALSALGMRLRIILLLEAIAIAIASFGSTGNSELVLTELLIRDDGVVPGLLAASVIVLLTFWMRSPRTFSVILHRIRKKLSLS